MYSKKFHNQHYTGFGSKQAWVVERGYTMVEEQKPGNYNPGMSASWQLKPKFPVREVKKSRPMSAKMKRLHQAKLTDNLIKRQQKMEDEYKNLRDFTRTGANCLTLQPQVLTPPTGFTNFVSSKPLTESKLLTRPSSAVTDQTGSDCQSEAGQEVLVSRPSSGQKENSSDEEEEGGKTKIKIPVCDMDVNVHPPNQGALHLAMDGLRIANNIEKSFVKSETDGTSQDKSGQNSKQFQHDQYDAKKCHQDLYKEFENSKKLSSRDDRKVIGNSSKDSSDKSKPKKKHVTKKKCGSFDGKESRSSSESKLDRGETVYEWNTPQETAINVYKD